VRFGLKPFGNYPVRRGKNREGGRIMSKEQGITNGEGINFSDLMDFFRLKRER
jgi:hypothetical protein